MKISMIPTTAVFPYSKNPRVNKHAVDKVATSIKEFGFRQPIVVDENMIVIAGHTRLLAAQKLNLTHVPVFIVTDLSPDKIKAYRIADNRVAQEASWNNTLLGEELHDLRNMGLDLTMTGFDLPELSKLLGDTDITASAPKDLEYAPKYEVVVECSREVDQEIVYKLMTSKGYKCRILSI